MFSGIVESTGSVLEIKNEGDNKHFKIKPDLLFDDLKIGDSIAVNGVCLTVTEFTNEHFYVTAVPETLHLTNIQFLNQNDEVNLERALQYGARIGGHCVQGHVDGMGTILEVTDHLTKISLPSNFSKYVVHKGFITLDGMSITIVEVKPEWFTVTLIPHTKSVTIAKKYHEGTPINIEVDVMGKNIEKLLGAYTNAIPN